MEITSLDNIILELPVSYIIYAFCPWLYPMKTRLHALGENLALCGSVLVV